MNAKKVVAVLAVFAACLTVAHADDRAKRLTYNNPVIMKSIPDPTVIRAADGYFYLYGTEDIANMPIHRSRNLVDWTYVGTAFTDATRPRNVRPYTKGMMWAPDINYINGQYVLYYSIGVWGSPWECGIGVATSERPEGPFVGRGTILMAKDQNVGNSIDQFYIEDGGKKYMTWGSYWGVYIIELSDDGLSVKPGAKKAQICGNQMEGSYIFKRNGYYYLIGSNGNCCEGKDSKYKLICGRSKSLFGPYVNKEGASMLSGNYTDLLVGNDYCAGPGHNAEITVDDNGDTWIIYHGYLRADDSKGRVVWLDQVKWSDDWPYIENGSPSTSSKAPYFKDAD